jgi:hypothetical protein
MVRTSGSRGRADHSVALQGSSSICFISTDFNLHFIVDVLAQLVMLCHTAEFRHELLNLNVGVNLNLLAFGFNLVDVWISLLVELHKD